MNVRVRALTDSDLLDEVAAEVDDVRAQVAERARPESFFCRRQMRGVSYCGMIHSCR